MKDKTVVLIVEDDKQIISKLKTILEMEEYKIDTANTGQKALEKGIKYPYDAVILDIKLPDMQGIALIPEFLKTHPETVIIILTGFPDQENTMEALNLGVKGYLTKPFDPEKLLKMMNEKIKEQRESVELTQDKMTQFIERRLEKLRNMG